MISPAAYIGRETAISIAINTLLSLVFFLLVFGRTDYVTIWGFGNYVFDFAPQGFMIAMMATLVSGLLTTKALRAGRVAPLATVRRLPARLLVRALVLGLSGAVIGVSGPAAILSLAQFAQIGWWPALIAKLVFGVGLAASVTPIGLRAGLCTP